MNCTQPSRSSAVAIELQQDERSVGKAAISKKTSDLSRSVVESVPAREQTREMTAEHSPPIETLKRLPKFLELLPKPWPGNLEHYFGPLREVTDWDTWWARAQHVFVRVVAPIPVQVISSEADYCLRDPEAEADGEQVTVVLNLWHSKKSIHDAIELLLNERRDRWPSGDPHEDWICEDFIVRAYTHWSALDEIYDVMKLSIVDNLTVKEIADLKEQEESVIRRWKQKGEHLLKMLSSRHVFPDVRVR